MTIFDSRDTKYKSPFGAVSCGTAVSFTVTPGPEYCACALVTYGEFAVIRGETALSPCPEGFTGTFTAPDTPELVWYTFRFTRTNGGSVYLGRNGLGGGDDRQPWQLTVYENRPTPEWFGQGVTYQIFQTVSVVMLSLTPRGCWASARYMTAGTTYPGWALIL